MKRGIKILGDALKKCAVVTVFTVLLVGTAAVIFYLYGLPSEPFVYVLVLILCADIFFFLFTFIREYKKALRREQMIREALLPVPLPPAETLCEEDYTAVIGLLRDELTKLKNEYASARQDDIDYYTAWVHQIKTPIAVMRMELGNDEASRALETELFRIEQYVDMVLTYLRLGSGSTDLVIRAYALDELVREAVRKFAAQFVAKKLQFLYEESHMAVVTDKKWFLCILEQILSNAIKYTPSGSIKIALRNGCLTVTDTGIGIAPEDLPRIFEKGYTGENGRLDKRSSGLGLYLCKKSADLLQIPLAVTAEVGKGSCFSLDLNGKLR